MNASAPQKSRGIDFIETLKNFEAKCTKSPNKLTSKEVNEFYATITNITNLGHDAPLKATIQENSQVILKALQTIGQKSDVIKQAAQGVQVQQVLREIDKLTSYVKDQEQEAKKVNRKVGGNRVS